MTAARTDAQARLETWRAQRSDRLDPLRFARIDALARRAAGQRGAVREILDARLAELVAAFDACVAAAPANQETHFPAGAAGTRCRGELAMLIHDMARGADARHDATDAPASTESLPAVARLEEVRRMCGDARAESQLREALEEAPENAGPLNSASLVHRALTLMREVSPEYLAPFMAYVDALAWLEGMDMHSASAATASPAGAGSNKRSRAKPRARRG
ncbi:DUF2894 domain-containing protein [Cognatilysobacter bugurensis]|nr:DUF2894 domain-containing protein [Lysobacter bugurensis]